MSCVRSGGGGVVERLPVAGRAGRRRRGDLAGQPVPAGAGLAARAAARVHHARAAARRARRAAAARSV